DRHAKAYHILTGTRSASIAKRLGLREPPTAAAKCLDCHAVNVPAAERGPKFRIEDGVTCEACHGPAGGWLARHSEKGWTPAQSRELGLRDTSEPAAA